MKRLLYVGLPLVLLVAGLPVLALMAVVTMTSQAAATCSTDTPAAATNGGPVTGTVSGTITMATANIPARAGLSGFRASMPKVLATHPDFVALQEVGQRSLAQLEAGAPGYTAYRDPTPDPGPGGQQAMNNAVLWNDATWIKTDAGRVKIIEDDLAYYAGRPVTWDRYATWVLLQRRSDGAVVSAVSVHQMTNPHKYPRQHGHLPLSRAQQYSQGMDALLDLVDQLATHGPVLIGGDLNTPASYTNRPWSAPAKMNARGYAWANHGVDYVLYPHTLGVRLAKTWTGPMASDHQWVAARLTMNGATATPSHTSSASGSTAALGDVLDQLMQLRLTPASPTLTRDQAENAITIAQVTRDLGVPRRGLEVALVTAIQESRLVNLQGGDRDSQGLFQQRPSQGWGTPAQVTDPVLATNAFYGRAAHTDNTGLLDIDGWQSLPLTQAAQAVQRSAHPNAYAQWEQVATDIADLLAPDLPDTVVPGADSDTACAGNAGPVTLASFNILGASHTDRKPGSGLGGGENASMPTWDVRLPKAMRLLEDSQVTVAGLQEVHRPQSRALSTTYAGRWGMFPTNGLQNKVIWDRAVWSMTDSRLIDIPYFYGVETPMPLVQLTAVATGQVIWVWSIHNPIGPRKHRVEALRRELDTLTAIRATGMPVVIVGDFNDAHDGARRSHCTLTPTLANAFGGSSNPCRPPTDGAPIDHLYGANLAWASARVDSAPHRQKISDHPLVIATIAGHSSGTGAAMAGDVGYPVPAAYVGADRHNWHASGGNWSSWHTGTDFSAPCGTPVYAALAGTVLIDTTQAWAGTWLVKITTGPSSLATWYAHMQTLDVARGQQVAAGQRIGTVGARGNATGCHLHFEVHLRNGSIYGPDNVDPSTWLAQHAARRDEGTGHAA